nr:DUF86 domain-containing protein [Candidatus Njordarchaeota archaeon]
MKKKDLSVYVEDMLDSILKIEQYIGKVTEQDFYNNTQVQDAVLRRLEIIGESVKNIPETFRKKYPEIPWKKIAGLRDVLIHAYSGVNLKRVWKVIKADIPSLKRNILKIRRAIKELSDTPR